MIKWLKKQFNFSPPELEDERPTKAEYQEGYIQFLEKELALIEAQIYSNYENHFEKVDKVVEVVQNLRDDNAKYESVLEFYAHREHYNPNVWCPAGNKFMSIIDYDEGSKAKVALVESDAQEMMLPESVITDSLVEELIARRGVDYFEIAGGKLTQVLVGNGEYYKIGSLTHATRVITLPRTDKE